MQITWLDVLAGNILGFLWIAGVLFAYREAKKDRTAFAWSLFFILLALGGGISVYRAGYWYSQLDAGPMVIVPAATAKQ